LEQFFFSRNFSCLVEKHSDSEEEDTADIGTTRRKQSIQAQNSLQDEPTVVHRIVVPAILALAIIIGENARIAGRCNKQCACYQWPICCKVKHLAEISNKRLCLVYSPSQKRIEITSTFVSSNMFIMEKIIINLVIWDRLT
jgi:hypothetical protein